MHVTGGTRAISKLTVPAILALAALATACAMPQDSGSSSKGATVAAVQRHWPAPTAPRSSPAVNGGPTQVLIYAGASSWDLEVDSLANVLLKHGVSYREVSSADLDALSLDELASFSLIIVPGGDAIAIKKSLSSATHEHIREAVRERGVSYLGFCAGAWLAVSPSPASGHDVSYGISIVDAPVQELTPYAKAGREFAISRARFPGGAQRDLLWWGGPITPTVPNGVVAKYADGTPAISQLKSGNGFVILSGLHPAATPFVLEILSINDPEAVDPELAWMMLESGIQRKPMPAF